MSLALNSLSLVEKKRTSRFFSTYCLKKRVLGWCQLLARFALLLPLMLLVSCSANTSRVDSDYCLYVDASSPYYNPNKLTQNQLEECEIRTKKILEIQAIQVEIQKNRAPAPGVTIPPQPLFDMPTPVENEPSRQTARAAPTQTARVINESIKPIYHTDAGASLVQNNQTVILVSNAGQSSQTLIESQTTQTQTVAIESQKSRNGTTQSTNGLNTLLEYQTATTPAGGLTQNDLRAKALNDAKSVSTSVAPTAIVQEQAKETTIAAPKSSETLLLMQQLKENKLPATVKTKTKTTDEVPAKKEDDTLAIPDQTPQNNDDETQPIPSFEPLSGF